MKNKSISSEHSLENASDDESRDRSTDGESCENRGRRRGRRKGDRKRTERRGTDVKRMMTPVVKVLLLGVLMSFLDVLYIVKHLEQSSANLTQNVSDNAKIKSTNFEIHENEDSTSDILAGRERILKLIKDAGISFDPGEDQDLIKQLPKWSDVVELYGPQPVIYGLNEGNCERFQAQTDKGDHFIGTAGMFNTGTNLMSELLIANCYLPDHVQKYGSRSRGVRWQVPWGKHSPVGDKKFRESHKTEKDKNVDAKEIMPIVTIRDPLIWLKSMCRHKYTARWEGFKEKDHCPNFLRKDLKLKVKYDGFFVDYESLMYLWNDWYNLYKNVDIPFLLVRFEDLVFHPEETVTKVCECGGGRRSSVKFRYIVDSAKKGKAAHGSISERTGFVDALVKYGNIEKRYKDFESIEDLEYVRDHVDQGLMEMMHYSSVDPQWNVNKKDQKT